MFTTLLTSVAALAALLPGPVADPKPYGSPPRPQEPKVALKLQYTSESGFAMAVTLDCEPAGGGHPKPEAACETLSAVGADPGRIEPKTTACVMIYAPVTAEVTGVWRRMPVKWTHKFGNTCEMRRATGVLFEF
ncbi:SSI family serine proteinase inhibitor [Actinoplanes sp. NPDC000266]